VNAHAIRVWRRLGALCAAALLAGPVGAAGLRDLGDGWLLGAGSCAAFLSPAGGGGTTPEPGAWVLAGSTRLHGMSDLPLHGLAAAWRSGKRPALPVVTVGWEVLAAPLWREESRRIAATWGWNRRLGVAGMQRVVRSGGAEFPARRRTVVRAVVLLGATWRHDGTRLDARLELPLQDPGPWSTRPARTRLLLVEASRPGLAAALAVDQRADGTPVVGCAVWVGAGGWACGWRTDPATGALGPVLAGRRGGLLVRTSHLVHPHLGATHRLQVGWGTWAIAPW
jgi:hypothetical protein